MRAVVQRVREARVEVDGHVVGSCSVGLLALVAAHRDDTEENARRLADRLRGLRVFNDAQGKMNLGLADVSGSLLVVSNFTVYGDADKSRRPSFVAAAPYEQGEALYHVLLAALRELNVPFQSGVFGADMQVHLINDGPVTLILEA